MFKSKSLRAVAVVAVVIIALLGFRYLRNVRRAAMADPFEGLAEAKAAIGDITRSITASGSISPGRRDVLYMPYSVKVMEVKARPGDVVLKGGLIVKYESTGLEQEADKVQSEIDQAKQAASAMMPASMTLSALSSLGGSRAAVESTEQLESSYKDLLDAKGRLTYKAPFDGLLAVMKGRVGQELAPSSSADPLVEVIGVDSWYASIPVSEFDVNSIKLDMEAGVSVPAVDDAVLEGKVSAMILEPVSSGGMVSYMVRVDIEGVSYKLKPGMGADVSIKVFEKSGVLTIPHGYAYDEDGVSKIITKGTDGKPLVKEITLGEEGDFGVEVTSGLSEGDAIFYDPDPGEEQASGGGIFNFRARMTDGR